MDPTGLAASHGLYLGAPPNETDENVICDNGAFVPAPLDWGLAMKSVGSRVALEGMSARTSPT